MCLFLFYSTFQQQQATGCLLLLSHLLQSVYLTRLYFYNRLGKFCCRGFVIKSDMADRLQISG
jgi:hypothetical protein